MSKKRKWRAKVWGTYFFVTSRCKTTAEEDTRHAEDDVYFNLKNYFRTQKQAEAAAEDVRKVFMRHAGKLHDFEWALKQLKQGKKIYRSDWNGEPCCIALNCEGYEDGDKYLVGYSLQDEAYGFQYGLKEEDMLATDWTLYTRGVK